MNINMTPQQWIMGAAGTLLTFVLWQIPATFNEKIDAMAKIYVERLDLMANTQKTMQYEHMILSEQFLVQCYNHAENVPDRDRRDRQMGRCLDRKLKEKERYVER